METKYPFVCGKLWESWVEAVGMMPVAFDFRMVGADTFGNVDPHG